MPDRIGRLGRRTRAVDFPYDDARSIAVAPAVEHVIDFERYSRARLYHDWPH